MNHKDAKHFTWDQRLTLERMLKKGFTKAAIASALGKRTIVFFCHPYSAFERGSNENMNRLIRRFFPKGTSFDNVKPEEVRAAERWVNNYPRKLLGWKSAAMLFEQELLTA